VNSGSNTLAYLNSTTIGVLYPITGQVYQGLSTGSVIYNQQNGQPTSNLAVAQNTSVVTTGKSHEYATFNIYENAVPGQTTPQDGLGFGIFNATSGVSTTPTYMMNFSTTGTKNNVTYTSTATSANTFNVQTGFRTERGSKVASISPDQVVFDLATAVDQLQFALTTAGSNSVVSKSTHTFGPYSIGQATNIPNVTISNVAASVSLNSASSNYSITGIDNLTGAITTSPMNATVPGNLEPLLVGPYSNTTMPLVVLDSQANQGSNLILIGSGYVNSLSAQLGSTVNITSPSSPVYSGQVIGNNRILVAGYTAGQTLNASTSFIETLYSNAASGQ